MSKRLGEPHETYQRCDIDGWMLSVGSEGDGWNEQRAGGSLVRPTGISPYRPSRPVTCVRASADLFFPFSSSLALLPLLRRRDLLSSYMSISSTTPPGYRARLESAETESHNAYFRSRFSERKKKKKKKKRHATEPHPGFLASGPSRGTCQPFSSAASCTDGLRSSS